MKYSIGIIGNGFVGAAIAAGFSPTCKVRIYDKNELRSLNTLDDTINLSDVVFVSVPTPMNDDGSINLGIVESVFEEISTKLTNPDCAIVLKSTVVPGTTKRLSEKYPNLNVVYNPEFLTERKAHFDFNNQSRIVLGGKLQNLDLITRVYEERFMHCNFVKTDTTTAEFIKYFGNLFFAVKVSFANEMKMMATKLGVNWDEALYGFVADGRVGDSHLHVPGPDGKMGFGGSCFPKDLNAFVNLADNKGINVNVLKAAWQTNLEVRPEKDWEQLKGRAVTLKDKGD
tara:strand:- start:531 stop:1385 length:855 start_codon:yes stop_codon:yes gene_type:complete